MTAQDTGRARARACLRSFCSTAALLACGAAATHAVAQDAADQPPQEQVSTVGDIVVTAQKRSESVNRVPMSITALTGDTLRELGVNDIADIAKVAPGFRATPSSYSTPIYTIRGVGFNESSIGAKPTVSVYVDEAPLPFGQTTPIATLDIARVEVLKGPQGTLFGQNSTGGALNFIAARPTAEASGGLDLSYGRFDTVEIGGFVSGPLSDTLRARAAFKVERGGDWQENYNRDDSLGAVDRLSGRLLLDWTPNDRLSVSLNLNHFYDKSDNQAAQFVYVTPFHPDILARETPELLVYPKAPAEARAADWTPGRARPRRDNDQSQVVLRADYDANDNLTLTSISSYIDYSEDRYEDPDGVVFNNFGVHTTGGITSFSQELRATGDIGDRLSYIVGANYERDTARQHDLAYYPDNTNAWALEAFGGGYTSTYDQSTQKIETRAVFGNLDFALTDQIKLHGGARYTEHDIDFTGCTGDADGTVNLLFTRFANYLRSFSGAPAVPDILPGACVTLGPDLTPGLVSRDFNQTNTSWRAGVDWTPAPGFLLYGNISKGYKAGSFPLMAASISDQFTPVSQESVLAYEAGFKASLLQRSLQLNGAIFYYDYQDKQIRGRTEVPVFGQLERLVNVPESSITGAEVQLNWRPVEGLTFNLGATWLDTEVKKGVEGLFSTFGTPLDITGERFPLTPEWQGNADLAYDWAIGSDINAFAGVSAAYQGDTTGAFGRDARYDIDAYTLVDLRLGVRAADDSWRLWAWGRNVTDEYYWTNADRIGDTSVRFAGRPATYGVSLSLRR